METTYYIVEIPHQRPPSAWKGTRASIIHITNKMSECSISIFEKSTAREQLYQSGYASPEEARAEDDDGTAVYIEALVNRFGWDTTIYHGYREFGEAEDWQTEPVDELDCALNYIGHDLSSLKVFCSIEEAWKAIADGVFNCHQGGRARDELEKILPHIKE